MALGSGCLYIEPTWQPNMEPEITTPTDYQSGDVVEVYLDFVNVVTVVANDEDSDRISCLWELPFDADWTCDRDGTFVTSLVYLDYDPELDDRLLTAHILDDLSAADVQVRFRIVVGGGP